MSWDFNHRAVLQELADIIDEVLGDRLSYLDAGQTIRSVVIGTDGVKPHLPYVQLTFNGTNDDDSWIIDSGLVEVTVEDPDNPPTTVTFDTLYTDTTVNFSVSITAVSDPEITESQDNYEYTNASHLLRLIRKAFLLPKYRKRMRDNVFTVMQLANNPIRSTPDILQGQTHERFTMRINMSSVDRTIDYDSGSFDTAKWDGLLYRIDESDPDPIPVSGSASSVIP